MGFSYLGTRVKCVSAEPRIGTAFPGSLQGCKRREAVDRIGAFCPGNGAGPMPCITCPSFQWEKLKGKHLPREQPQLRPTLGNPHSAEASAGRTPRWSGANLMNFVKKTKQKSPKFAWEQQQNKRTRSRVWDLLCSSLQPWCPAAIDSPAS